MEFCRKTILAMVLGLWTCGSALGATLAPGESSAITGMGNDTGQIDETVLDASDWTLVPTSSTSNTEAIYHLQSAVSRTAAGTLNFVYFIHADTGAAIPPNSFVRIGGFWGTLVDVDFLLGLPYAHPVAAGRSADGESIDFYFPLGATLAASPLWISTDARSFSTDWCVGIWLTGDTGNVVPYDISRASGTFGPSAVPEPGTAAALIVGGILLCFRSSK